MWGVSRTQRTPIRRGAIPRSKQNNAKMDHGRTLQRQRWSTTSLRTPYFVGLAHGPMGPCCPCLGTKYGGMLPY
jgi:hypothetical protein